MLVSRTIKVVHIDVICKQLDIILGDGAGDELMENLNDSDISFGDNCNTLVSINRLMGMFPEEMTDEQMADFFKLMPKNAMVELGC